LTAIVTLDQNALALAQIIKGGLQDARIHGLRKRVDGADVPFDETKAHLQDLFLSGETIIGICAAGILIRGLAPVLKDKTEEPPVMAISADGATVVPLLGGHHGGNRMADEVAALTGGHAAVTTAGDVRLGVALDEPPDGWRIANPEAAKDVTARLIAGEDVSLKVTCGNPSWLRDARATFTETETTPDILVTEKSVEGGSLVMHPPVLALGVGCERDCPPEDLVRLAEETLSQHALSPLAIACVVSIDVKMDEPAVLALARHFDVPARFFDAKTLEAESPRLANPSDVVFEEVGCHGVAEGAALAAVGPGGTLQIEKHKSQRATCAVGFLGDGFEPALPGRARGTLSIVGIGPGSTEWRTPAATEALRKADGVVGYSLYLDLAADVIGDKPRYSSELAQEEERVRKSLDLAAEGRNIALVCSGDAGIYALATLAFELVDRESRPDWNRLDISVTPGVSAFQAAASRMGAPMGHDFCTISLSDLLTPWEEIERRLKAAAMGDFVVAFYNPVSKRRRTQLAEAKEILLSARPPQTPVALARNLGREGETLDVISLGDLTPDHADMLTMVIVGNSQTKFFRQGPLDRVYTPRGYASKMEVAE